MHPVTIHTILLALFVLQATADTSTDIGQHQTQLAATTVDDATKDYRIFAAVFTSTFTSTVITFTTSTAPFICLVAGGAQTVPCAGRRRRFVEDISDDRQEAKIENHKLDGSINTEGTDNSNFSRENLAVKADSRAFFKKAITVWITRSTTFTATTVSTNLATIFSVSSACLGVFPLPACG